MRWKVEDPLKGLAYGVADMRIESGESVRWEFVKAAPEIAPLVVQQLAETPAYRLVADFLPPDKVDIYFVNRVKREILPVMRALSVAQWHSERSMAGQRHEVVWDNHGGLGPALQAVWPSESIPLILGRRKYDFTWRSLAGQLYRRSRWLSRHWRRTLLQRSVSSLPVPPGPTIAVHYVQGLDLLRRSDLFWHEASLVDPKRILIFFEGRPPAPESTLRDIEELGMRWVCLEYGQVARNDAPVWRRKPSHGSLLLRFQLRSSKVTGPTNLWAMQASEWLLQKVDYWMSFYQEFNVKVHAEVSGGQDYHLAQSIALDLTDGVRVGWQRSEQLTAEGTDIGHHPNHAYFTWSARALGDAASNRHRIGPVIVSGFPYDGAWDTDAGPRELRETLADKGASFVVALFDNVIIPEGSFSRSMILALYTAFLDWVLEDPQIAVVSKSKRSMIFRQLPEIGQLMSKAEATGRWINLTDSFGRLPSDASRAADMSVGIGVSTAANEAVAAGGKAVHCDLTVMRYHPFYQWGYEKVVFDDLERMMGALKRFVADPESEPGLGDFSQNIDDVDPFRDGRAGERIGSYIGCLLRGFDAGLDRSQSIQQANDRYANDWGANYVIRPQDQPSPAGI